MCPSGKSEAFFEEASVSCGSRSLKSLFSLTDSASASAGGITHLLHLIWEYFCTFIRTMIAILPEEWQPNPNLHEWHWTILAISAFAEVILLIGIVWIAHNMVKSTLLFIYRLNEKLQLEERRSCELEEKNKILAFQLNFHESEKSYQEFRIRDIQEQLETFDKTCQEREIILMQKLAWKQEEAKVMQEKEDLKEKRPRHTLKVYIREESITAEIRDMEKIRRMLDEIKMTLAEIQNPVFESSPGDSAKEDPCSEDR